MSVPQELENAFNDLNDEDDDETMDNSYRSSTSYQSQVISTDRMKRHYLGDQLHNHHHQDEDDEIGNNDNVIYRLRIELQSKTNELVHLNKVRSGGDAKCNRWLLSDSLSGADRREAVNTKTDRGSKKATGIG